MKSEREAGAGRSAFEAQRAAACGFLGFLLWSASIRCISPESEEVLIITKEART